MSLDMSLPQIAAHIHRTRELYREQAAAGYPFSASEAQADYRAFVEMYAETLPIYTTGYAAWGSLRAFQAALERTNALVVDVRETPYSKMPDWTGENLAAKLGASYAQIREWGNTARKRGGIQIADFEGGLRRLIKLTPAQPVLLLCGCRDYGTCHRATLADKLIDRGFSVQEYSIVAEKPVESARVRYWELSSTERERVKREYQKMLKEKGRAA